MTPMEPKEAFKLWRTKNPDKPADMFELDYIYNAEYGTAADVVIIPHEKELIDIESYGYINGRSGFAYIDEASFYYDYPYQWDHLYYPGLHYLNLAMYENIYGSMRMCRKLRDFLKPVAPVNDLRNSACYPMGIPERKSLWSDNVIDMIFTEDKIIAAINRKQSEYKYNINHQYGKYGR